MFVRATYDRERRTVHYFDADGNETLYIGGSFAWRMSNPGNLTKLGRYVMQTAIGYAQRTSNSKALFIIFPDRASGQLAHQKLLKEVYGDKTIRGMITAYAPPSENDTEGYISHVTKKAGVSSSDVVGSLSDEKFKAVSEAMEQKEGWVPGVVKYLGKPVQVQMLDKSNQPFAGQSMQIKGEQGSFDARTNDSGELPWIYSGLLGDNVHIAYKRDQDVAEAVGGFSSSSPASAFTFNAPYHLVPTRPRLHDGAADTRPRVHIVQSGETISSIAAKYGTTVDALVSANGLKDPDHIYARQHLKVPPMAGEQAQASPTHAPAADAETKAQPVPKPMPANASKQSGATGGKTTASVATPPAAASSGSVAGKGSASHGAQRANPAPAAAPAQPQRASANAGASANPNASGVIHQRSPNGRPQTVVSSPTLEPSGAVWCQRFPGSASLESLNDTFKAAASAFIGAMRNAHITVKVNAALRPIQRSYLMYHAFQIAKGHESPDKVPPYSGVNIDWVHRKPDGSMDLEKSVKAAKDMCAGFEINIHSARQAVGKPGRSRHNYGAAVDINITGYVGKKIKDASGHEVELKSFADLKLVGYGYGVHYYPKENMHWSDTGR